MNYGNSNTVAGYGSYDSLLNGTFASTSTDNVVANRSATSEAVQSNEVHLTVNVPENAKLFVNGNPTSSVGSKRHFVSRELNANELYRFEVKVVIEQEGKEVAQTKTVIAKGGTGEEIYFDSVQNDDPVETVLTLNVPVDAKVTLANNQTKNDGTTRVYRTKQLRTGETWDDYKIEVTLAGVTKEKTIRLIGGDKLEVSFNFDDSESSKVASK